MSASTGTKTKPAIRSVARKAGLFYFVWVMFSYCTGGPFGLEDMITTSGPGMSLLYLLFLPLFWSIPVSLVSAELTTAMPVEGGFYRWTRVGFGDLWGFLAGWWNWCASFLLGAAYAVQFSDYLGFYFPQLTGRNHYIVSLLIVALITYINVRGIEAVGKFATALEIFILLPVLALVVIGLTKWHHNPFTPFIPTHVPPFRVFGVGLALGLWLYSGYEQCSTVAEEVQNPQRSYPLALAIVVPMSVAVYFLPTFASLAALGNWQQWHTRYFSDAAQLIGGPWLGAWMTIAAMITNISLLNATVLTSTRMPFAMAEDGYLPHRLTAEHTRFGTPWIAIIASAVVYGALSVLNLTQLISIYSWLRIATTILTVLAAWQLRRKQPDMKRPFRIPGGGLGLAYAVAAPIVMSVVAMLGSDRYGTIGGIIALAIGPLVYVALRSTQH
ncbi:MAG TPA: APC family permease [Terriglobales bacterium]|nr:APC family permease [Terriglobales bacterium]